MNLPSLPPATYIAALTSLVRVVLLVFNKRWHGRFSMDGLLGIQKMHTKSTREPAPAGRATAISLGKINHLLRALARNGLLKASNFRSSHNKLTCAYLLTPEGIVREAASRAVTRSARLPSTKHLRTRLSGSMLTLPPQPCLARRTSQLFATIKSLLTLHSRRLRTFPLATAWGC